MNFCGIQLDAAESAALAGVALTLASELIGASPLKENSIVQLGMTLLRRFIPTTSHTPVQKAAPRTTSQESQSPAPKRRGRPPSKKTS